MGEITMNQINLHDTESGRNVDRMVCEMLADSEAELEAENACLRATLESLEVDKGAIRAVLSAALEQLSSLVAQNRTLTRNLRQSTKEIQRLNRARDVRMGMAA